MGQDVQNTQMDTRLRTRRAMMNVVVMLWARQPLVLGPVKLTVDRIRPCPEFGRTHTVDPTSFLTRSVGLAGDAELNVLVVVGS
jgi:hypothetical protein